MQVIATWLLWSLFAAGVQGDLVGVRLLVVRSEAEATAILTQVRNGANFEELARRLSIDSSAAAGGYLGAFEPSQLRPEFQAALRDLRPGEVSGVIRIGREFALLQNAVIIPTPKPSPSAVQQAWAAALSTNNIERVRQLLASGTADVVYDDGSTVLMGAAQDGLTEIVRALLTARASVSAQAADGTTALTVAAYGGHAEIARMLLSAGADPNTNLRDGSTPLMKASQAGHADVVRLLLQAGANARARANNGLTALMEAAFAGHFEVVRVLLESKPDVNAALANGSTALMAAAQKGATDIAAALLAAGADPKAKSATGGTALMEAAYSGHAQTVRLLLKAGSDLDAVTSEGLTALMGAALGGHTEAVNALLEAGANPNIKDAKGWTALTHARASANSGTVRTLLGKTAGLSARDRNLVLGGVYVNEYYASNDPKLLDLAAAEFQQVLNSQPQDAAALEWLGAIEFLRWGEAPSLEQFRKAAALLRKSADLDPKDPDRQYWLAAMSSIFITRGKGAATAEITAIVEEGILRAEKAIELDPEFSDALDHLSVLYRRKGDGTAADAAHSKAERIRQQRGNRPSRFNDQFSRPAVPAAPKL